MSYELQQHDMGPGVVMWQPSADLLHDPNVVPQDPGVEAVLLGLPLGECGGVKMANKAIGVISAQTGGPVYGNHQPTHGADATARMAEQGARFDIPPGAIAVGMPYVISAHGAAPSVAREARERGLNVFDVTCPLVVRTHEAIKGAKREDGTGRVAYISFGSHTHAELVGAQGLAEESDVPFTVVSDSDGVDELLGGAEKGDTITIVGQTTNNSDEADKLAAEIRDRASTAGIQVARAALHDVCHTVRDRQNSTREIIREGVGALVVVGSVNSKNTVSLAKVAAAEARQLANTLSIYLINGWGQLPHLDGRVGVVSGASTLKDNVFGVVNRLAPIEGVTEVGIDTDKGITFMPVDRATRKLWGTKPA